MAGQDAQSLIDTEHTRRMAIEIGDFDALEAMTADHFHYAHINGLVESREEYFTRLRGDATTVISSTSASDLSVTPRDGYALLLAPTQADAPFSAVLQTGRFIQKHVMYVQQAYHTDIKACKVRSKRTALKIMKRKGPWQVAMQAAN
ncbi:MAG: hypothetical protein EOO38_32800 [Cytophagaceae bacterium]|nr:MAG: hypothetical protein EOO38_32800 [Cytophagaceae bacterium]